MHVHVGVHALCVHLKEVVGVSQGTRVHGVYARVQFVFVLE